MVVSSIRGRREVEEPRQVAVLEDPHHGAEGGGEAERVDDECLHRHEQTTEHQEQQYERGDDDDRKRPRQAFEDPILHVDQLSRRTAHQ